MVRKLRVKMILITTASLLFLFVGTISAVYFASYREILEKDREMLERYAAAYWKNGSPKWIEQEPPPGIPPRDVLGPDMAPSGQFYSVELDETGEVLATHIPENEQMDAEQLSMMAKDLVGGKKDGVRGRWVYHWENESFPSGKALLVLLDNVLVDESYYALFRNTRRFGFLLFLLLVILAAWASGMVVKPLIQADREQKRFLSDAGHELKTPVAVITANLELLERDVGSNHWLENIRRENTRMVSLVENLLTLTRMEEVRLPLSRLDLGREVEKAVLVFEVVAFEAGHLLEQDLEEGLFVRGNEKQLESLFSIFLENACEHSLPGSSIGVSLRKQGGQAVLSFQNTCPIMDEGEVRHLFDRFYQVDKARGGESHCGLGLSIAKRIVESLEGSVQVRYEAGRSAITFIVFFPLA